MFNKYKHLLNGALFITLFSASCVAFALPIRVSQETSAGAGDFDSNILGYD